MHRCQIGYRCSIVVITQFSTQGDSRLRLLNRIKTATSAYNLNIQYNPPMKGAPLHSGQQRQYQRVYNIELSLCVCCGKGCDATSGMNT